MKPVDQKESLTSTDLIDPPSYSLIFEVREHPTDIRLHEKPNKSKSNKLFVQAPKSCFRLEVKKELISPKSSSAKKPRVSKYDISQHLSQFPLNLKFHYATDNGYVVYDINWLDANNFQINSLSCFDRNGNLLAQASLK